MTLTQFLSDAALPLTDLTGLGTSGVMGAMWLWERRTSRQREQQLDEAHARIMADKTQLDQLVSLVRQNTEALTHLASTQDHLLRRLEQSPRANVEGASHGRQ
jgi:hypothetical protein